MRGSFARSCAGAIEAANNRTVASVLKRFEGISAEEAKALGEGTIKVSELKTVKAIHAKTMYAPEETVYERVSFPFGTSNNKPRIPRQHKRGTGRRGKEGREGGGRKWWKSELKERLQRACSQQSLLCAVGGWVGGWVVKRGREINKRLAHYFDHFNSNLHPLTHAFSPLFFPTTSELACATVVGVIFGGTWKMYHWNERRKINDFYAKHGEMYGVKR